MGVIEMAKAMIRIVVDRDAVRPALEATKAEVSAVATEIGQNFTEKSKLELNGKSAGETIAKLQQDAHVAAKRANEISEAFKNAEGAVSRFQTKLSSGGTITQRAIMPIIQQAALLKSQLEATYGTIDRATPEAISRYRALEREIERAKKTVRELTDEFEDQKGELAEAGFQWRGLGDAVGIAAGKYGKYVAGAAAGSLVVREVIGLTKMFLGTFDTGELQVYESWWNTVKGKITETKTEMADFVLWHGRMMAAVLSGNNADVDALEAARRRGDVAALPGDVKRTLAQQGYRFGYEQQTNVLRFRQNRDQYEADPMAGLVGGSAEEIGRQLALKQRELELAKARGVATAQLAAEVDNLTRLQMVATGSDSVHADRMTVLAAEIRKVTAATQARVEAERKLNEERARQDQRNSDFSQAVHGAIALPLLNRGDALMPSEAVARRANDEFAAAVAEGASGPSSLQGVLTASLLKPQQTLMQQMAAEWRANATTMLDVYKSAVGEVGGLFSDVLFAGMTGKFDSMDDYFKNFLGNMRRRIAQFLADKAVQMILDKMSSAGGTWGAVGSFFSGILSQNKKANGGVFSGGFQAFAMGGVVSQPTLGLVGEGRYNEAVVPLPDGKSIPVVMGRESRKQELVQHMTITLASDFFSGMRPFMQPTENELVAVVGGNILRNGQLRQIIKSTVG